MSERTPVKMGETISGHGQNDIKHVNFSGEDPLVALHNLVVQQYQQ